MAERPRVLIVGGGFAGLNCARRLGQKNGAEVMLIDRRNHHLFQPLLYQVAMAGLSPADIAAPIRGLLGKYKNIKVLQATVESVDRTQRRVITNRGEYDYDYLLLAAGAQHAYFGHNEWEPVAPGLRNVGASDGNSSACVECVRAGRNRDQRNRAKVVAHVRGGWRRANGRRTCRRDW